MIEVRSAPWQKMAATGIFTLLGVISGMLMLALLFPSRFPNESIRQASEPTRIIYGLFLGWLFLTGFYVWWGTWRYVLRADAEGVMQSNGFRTVRVAWSEIASYTSEPVRGTRDRLVEPVLRDVNGQVLLRPFSHPFISTADVMRDRAVFWKNVTERLDSRTLARSEL